MVMPVVAAVVAIETLVSAMVARVYSNASRSGMESELGWEW
jgi:hypothetical protein